MIEPVSCNCEPCEIDLSVLFPGATIFYEDPKFSGTRCKWHWVVRFKNKKHLEVSPSGDGYLWVSGLDGSAAFELPVSEAARLDRAYHAIR